MGKSLNVDVGQKMGKSLKVNVGQLMPTDTSISYRVVNNHFQISLCTHVLVRLI